MHKSRTPAACAYNSKTPGYRVQGRSRIKWMDEVKATLREHDNQPGPSPCAGPMSETPHDADGRSRQIMRKIDRTPKGKQEMTERRRVGSRLEQMKNLHLCLCSSKGTKTDDKSVYGNKDCNCMSYTA